MKATELIEALTPLVDKHGDLDVRMFTMPEIHDVDSVEFVDDTEFVDAEPAPVFVLNISEEQGQERGGTS